LAISKLRPAHLILGADTLVYLNDGAQVFGQPQNESQAVHMLEQLSGKTHQVVTGFAWWTGKKLIRDFVISKVTFRKLKPAEISAYVKAQESLDKAGGYAVQGAGAALVERIDGSLTNVIGLPIKEVFGILEQYLGG
jgi:septum formation protein